MVSSAVKEGEGGEMNMVRLGCDCHGWISIPQSTLNETGLDWWLDQFDKASEIYPIPCKPSVEPFVVAKESK